MTHAASSQPFNVNRTVWGIVAALVLVAATSASANDADVVRLCQRYLTADENEQRDLAQEIEEFDGPIGPVIDELAGSAAVVREDVSGVVASQSFTHPELKHAYAEDLLHYFVPDDYSPDEAYGLLIFMHGGGPRTPREFPRHVVTHPDNDPESYGLQPHFESSPFILVAPSAPWNEKTGARWNVPEADEYIRAVIKECQHRFHLDSHRVFLGGYSMGGFGAFHLCQRLSDRLAGGVIFSGAWKTTHWKAWTGLPVFLRHGANDAAPPGPDGQGGRPRYTDVFYSRAVHQRMNELGIEHVYREDAGGHSLRSAEEAIAALPQWMQRQRRDPFARQVVAVSPRGWKAFTDTPSPHCRWVTIHEIGPEGINFDAVEREGPSPAWNETREAFGQQRFRLGTRRVDAGLIDATIADNQRIVVRSENVKRFSLWLHPAMVDFSSPIRVSVNGAERENQVTANLLEALQSYQRQRDWGLIYHAELQLTVE